jgi:hypothetical protein
LQPLDEGIQRTRRLEVVARRGVALAHEDPCARDDPSLQGFCESQDPGVSVTT